MAKVLSLVNGIPRMVDSTAGAVYEESIEIVESNPTGNQLVGPISAGTSVTLPNTQTYTLNSDTLQLQLNSQPLEKTYDFNEVTDSTFSLTFEVIAGDRIDIRIDHS